MLLLVPLLLSPALAACLLHPGHVEFVRDLGSELEVRVKREAGSVCKYKKGEWSPCEPLTQLVTRQDTLKAKSSSPECGQTRTLTKHCRQQEGDGQVTCVFAKSKTVPWTECLLPGVRQKVLELVSQTGEGVCPRQKLLSRKCKDEKKVKDKKKKKKKAEKKAEKKAKKAEKKAERKAEKAEKKEAKKAEKDKCKFGDWGAWGECTKGRQQRTRQVTKGTERPACQKKSVATRTC